MAIHDTGFLPTNGVLLHIGPHKTGTSALQSALEASRADLADLGVHVPPERMVWRAVHGVTGMPQRRPRERPADGRDWDALVDWVRNRPHDRVFVSSEHFDDCTPAMIHRVVADLGLRRVRIMVTLRPLERIVPSTWQQLVRGGRRVESFEEWLAQVLRGPDADGLTARAARFWYMHDHAALVDRWAQAVGPAAVVVVVGDEQHPDRLFGAAAQILGLPAGALHPGRASNRSLTATEIEAVRAMYAVVGDKDDPDRRAWLMGGAVALLVEKRTPPGDEPRLRLPRAAALRLRDIGAVSAARLAVSGVRIVGDIDALVPRTPLAPDPTRVPPARVDYRIAARLTAGLARTATAALLARRSPARPPTGDNAAHAN